MLSLLSFPNEMNPPFGFCADERNDMTFSIVLSTPSNARNSASACRAIAETSTSETVPNSANPPSESCMEIRSFTSFSAPVPADSAPFAQRCSPKITLIIP